MKISAEGIELIKKYEGCRLKAYRCPAGVPTIGYGHTLDVRMNQRITQQQADELLCEDLRLVEEQVTLMTTDSVTQNRFDALVSFAFNLGADALSRSTLLRCLLRGDIAGAAAEFDKWIYAGGVILAGLERRRAAEKALFIQG
jgi:lysozyme